MNIEEAFQGIIHSETHFTFNHKNTSISIHSFPGSQIDALIIFKTEFDEEDTFTGRLKRDEQVWKNHINSLIENKDYQKTYRVTQRYIK